MMPGAAKPLWPLKTAPKEWSKTGSFGAARPSSKNPTRVHQGVDLYAPEGAAVLACEDGIVVASQGWSGEGTKAVFVESKDTGILLVYGAVAPGSYPSKGVAVKRGQQIAKVGVYPQGSTMLHLETWAPGVRPARPKWSWGAAKPSQLYDVSEYLSRAMGVDVEPQADDDDAPELDDDQGDVQDPKPPAKGGGGGGLIVAAAALVGGIVLLR